ncbi:hypothetical protein PVAP13_9NG649766 [Panicum virgatum]|uniref:Uncharacterized protein n=1 Tax=Panicum virgatum TaxID=38727 RepID=A0A8T0N6B4_PANVG|nr:hypothetical protein PVAP13_9NG649766 [Panicum virgatum]
MESMSTEERALINQRRRELYHVEKLLRTEEEVKKEKLRNRLPARKEGKREYKRRMKEFRANLHPDSIAMANPQFVPELVVPTPIELVTSASELVIPGFSGSPVYIPPIFHATIGKNHSCTYDADGCGEQLSTESHEGN